MSKNPIIKKEEPVEPTTDMNEVDVQRLQKYVDEGLPGIASVSEAQIARMFGLYLDGHSYRQISQTLSLNKAIILYMSKKFDWFVVRREYMSELEHTIRQRVIEAKLQSQDFLLQLTYMWQKKIGSNLNKYLATGNEEWAKAIDLKEVDKYLKTIEMIERMNSETVVKRIKESSPAVGLNLGDGVTITKKGDNSVEITPKAKTTGEMLKYMADLKRNQGLDAENSSDIDSKNEGEIE